MDHQDIADIVRLGPRVPTGRRAIGTMDGSFIHVAVPDRVIEARSTTATTTTAESAATTSDDCGVNACEKPVGSSTFTLPIVLGIAIPVVGAFVVFMILTRRHSKKIREEDLNDRHASMDFGLGDVPRIGARKGPIPKEMSFGDEKPGPGLSKRQISLDLGQQNNNPYLLPPTLQNSRESLQSLSRTIDQEDPYRPVAGYYAADGQSIRSQSKQGSSIYTGSSAAPSRLHDLGTAELLPNASRMSRSTAPNGFVLPPRQNPLPPRGQSLQSPVESLNKNQLPCPAEPPQAYIAELGDYSQVQRSSPPNNGYPGQINASVAGMGDENNRKTAELESSSNDYFGNMTSERGPSLPAPVVRMSPPAPLNTSLPSNARPVRKESSLASNNIDAGSDYGDGFMITPPSPGREQQRGQRYSMDVPPEQFAKAGLGAPGFDPKRLSMGFRPLPPNAVTEGDDPEIRANRIRSFYKEYFDDSKPAPQGQYIEDYDENYMGDATHYDPGANAFVLPYNEPITRRAMTPPPNMGNGPRFQPPRPRQGSMGAMSAGGPFRGPPQGQRSNSPGPSRMGPQAPRSYSSASGRMGPLAQQKRMPPPEALNTLPTPSKLRDDTFAINPMDFAPPSTYRDRVAGRSESPMGERRPYSPAVQAFAPVVSAFDELAPMPSPHMFRKSGTFTSLDFAPPKKFRDADNMSDAGSIRSNRSGISQLQNQAIRNGAYRVSKLPTDVVFNKDDLNTTLKPQWGMRPS